MMGIGVGGYGMKNELETRKKRWNGMNSMFLFYF
jgi:hypothetical protein